MSVLRKFVDSVDHSRDLIKPTTRSISVHTDILIPVRDYIAAQLERNSKGGKVSRGHRYQNVDDSQLSQNPRAIRERQRRREKRLSDR